MKTASKNQKLALALLSATCLTSVSTTASAAPCPSAVAGVITVNGASEGCVVGPNEVLNVTSSGDIEVPSSLNSGIGVDYDTVTAGLLTNDGRISGGTSSNNNNTTTINVSGSTIDGITNNGRIEDGNNSIISINSSTVTGQINNTSTGIISGPYIGLDVNNNSKVNGGILNSGKWNTVNGHAIGVRNGSTVDSITNNADAIISGGDSKGIYLSGGIVTNDILNSGLIDGGEGAIIIEGSTVGGDIVNDDRIESYDGAAIAIYDNSLVSGKIINNSTLKGTQGIYIDGSEITSAIENFGTIEGTNGNAITINDPTAPVTIQNSGTILGSIVMENTTFNINADNLNVDGSITGTDNSSVFINGDFTTKGDIAADSGIYLDFDKTLTTTHDFTTDNFNNLGTFVIDPVGTTTITGDYNQDSGATLRIAATNPSDYSKLLVTGTGNFGNNTTIDVDVRGSSFTNGTTLTDVIKAGTLNASTFSVTDNSHLYDFTAQVNATSVDLITAMTSTIADSAAETGSKNTGAATALDAIIAGGNAPEIAAAFGSLTSAQEVANAVSTTVPSTPAASATAVMQTMDNVGRIVQAREEANLGLSSGDGFLTSKNMWFKPFASWSNQDNQGGISGFDGDTYGFVGGIDGTVSDKSRLGVAIAYANTDVDSKSSIAKQGVEIDSYQLAIYGSRSLENRTELSFQTDFGYNNNDSTRNINIGGLTSRAEADFDSWSFRASAGLGRTYDIGAKTTITPSARVDYALVRTDSYTESGAGALNLNVDSAFNDQLIPAVEAKLVHRANDKLSFSANGGVGYDVISDDSTMTASFAGGGGVFTTTGIEPSPWVIRSGVGVTYQATDSLDLTARYDREDRGSEFDTNTVSLKARLPF